MTNSVAQIVTEFETLGLSVAQIAEIEGLVVPAVKSILMTNSAKYRSESESNGALGFDSTDETLALHVIRRVATYSEDDHTALKAAMFIRNDSKGRLDVKSGIKRLNINVQVLNDHFAKAAAALAGKLMPQKAIDV